MGVWVAARPIRATRPSQPRPYQRPRASASRTLQVGTLLHVKTPGDASRAAASRLIGFIDQGLFVTWPTLGGRDLAVQAGETVLLRGFSGQAIHSFTSTITAVHLRGSF